MVQKIKILIITILLSVLSVHTQTFEGKCGTWRSFERLKNKLLLKQEKVTSLRPVLDTSIVSPGGRFRIHFNVDSTDVPALLNESGIPIPNTHFQYADSVAKVFDEVYEIEIHQFNYPAPAGDGIKGGGNEYDIYIQHQGVGYYGYTDWEEDDILTSGKINPQYASFVVIDDAFEAGYYTRGIDAVRVTAAHEFHHMIEVSASGVWNTDYYFYELSATSIESTVYPEIRDYIQYIKTYYSNTNQWPLFLQAKGTGYERGIFGKFLIERYSPSILNSIWNEIKTLRPVNAIQNALKNYSTSLEREFAEFTIWNYYTNYRADSSKYFSDAKLFPLVQPFAKDSIVSAQAILQEGMKSFSVHYDRVLSKQAAVDTIDFIIANTNYNDALNSSGQTFFYDLRVSPFQDQGFQLVANGVYSKFSASDATNWSLTTIAKNGIIPKLIANPFPNPFRPQESSLLIPLQNFIPDKQNTLLVYSSSMDLVFSKPAKYSSFSGTQYAEWDGRDDKGNIVPTGIYLYVLSRGDEIIKGKFAVIR